MAVGSRRKFGKHYYIFNGTDSTKIKALNHAAYIANKGYYTRVVPMRGRWAVYMREMKGGK
jgi:hypothetical protein